MSSRTECKQTTSSGGFLWVVLSLFLFTWVRPVQGVQPGHQKCVNSVVFSPDGKTLATSSDDRTAKLWEAATGRLRATFRNPDDTTIESISLSSNGRFLAADCLHRVIVWDLNSGSQMLAFGMKGTITSLLPLQSPKFSPDGKLLATGTDNGVLLWDLKTGRQRAKLNWPSALVRCVAFSPDGQILAAGSSQNAVRLWNMQNLLHYGTLEHNSTVGCMAFSRDGRQLATGCYNNTARIWDPYSQKLKRTWEKGVKWTIQSVAFSPDGRLVATEGRDEVWLWDVATGKLKATLKHGPSSYVKCLAFSPDGRSLATGCDDSTIWLWNLSTGTPRYTLGTSLPIAH